MSFRPGHRKRGNSSEMRSTWNNQFDSQQFTNEYQLVNGLAMHAENPHNFHVPPEVIKRHVRSGQLVELRIDSPRFSVHEDALEKCSCPSCNGELTKPILKHDHPASLVPLPKQNIPSRGGGEDFWVRVTERLGSFFRGVVTGMSKIAADNFWLARAFQQRQLRSPLFPQCLATVKRRGEKAIATMLSLFLKLQAPGVG
jgi:hypothetical protein